MHPQAAAQPERALPASYKTKEPPQLRSTGRRSASQGSQENTMKIKTAWSTCSLSPLHGGRSAECDDFTF